MGQVSSPTAKTNVAITREKMSNNLNGILTKKTNNFGVNNKNNSVKQWIESQPNNYHNNGESTTVRLLEILEPLTRYKTDLMKAVIFMFCLRNSREDYSPILLNHVFIKTV